MTKNVKFPVSFSSFILLAIAFAVCSCNSAASENKNAEAQNTTDSAGFISIFDGGTLNGWEGDTAVWHVEDGAITGEVTATSTPLKANTFLIWKDGQPADFELTAEYEISPEGNSGIQYRSEEVEGVPFGLKGYQMDIDGSNTYTGQNYEERARSIMAFRGQKVTLPPVTDSISKLVKNNVWSVAVVNDSLGNPDSLKAKINAGWNTCRIVAKGNHLQHYINDVLMCDVTDNDTTNRKDAGLIGVQLHAGHIMRVAYKNIKLKSLK
jgi:3-keto-disaccharide hydrolase